MYTYVYIVHFVCIYAHIYFFLVSTMLDNVITHSSCITQLGLAAKRPQKGILPCLAFLGFQISKFVTQITHSIQLGDYYPIKLKFKFRILQVSSTALGMLRTVLKTCFCLFSGLQACECHNRKLGGSRPAQAKKTGNTSACKNDC